MTRRLSRIIFLVVLCVPFPAAAGIATLPRGVGLVRVGVRSYLPISEEFDVQGNKGLIGKRFEVSFTGPKMLEGKGGSELKKLAEEIRRYDPDPSNPLSPINRLNLGHLEVNANANINATFAGVGLGLSDWVTVYAGAPYINAKVAVSFKLAGTNNAQQISDELGALAYPELKEGLRKASLLNTEQIISSLAASGYTGFDGWQHNGLGDFQTGALFNFTRIIPEAVSRTWKAALGLALSLPTGYKEDPSNLADLSFGAVGPTFGTQPRVQAQVLPWAAVNADASYIINFRGRQFKRVPVNDETSVAADRHTEVTVNPGDNSEVGLGVECTGASLWPWLGVAWHVAAGKKGKDQISGDRAGNYESLVQRTETTKVVHDVLVYLTSVDLFRAGKFPVPLLFEATYRSHLGGTFVYQERSIEVSISSFFPTPFASTSRGQEGTKNPSAARPELESSKRPHSSK